MDSLIPILAITPPSLIFFIFSVILFLKWKRKRDRQTLYFAVAFLFMGLCFGMWVIRTLFYPPHVELSEVNVFIRLGYICGITGTAFVALTAMEMVNPESIRKIENLIYFLAPAIALTILIVFIAEPIPTVIANQVDFVWSEEVAFVTSLVGIYYFTFPNYLFIWWLMNYKDHRLYTRIMLLEIGLLIFCAGIILEGSKIGMESFGILVRWIAAFGGAVMAYAYTRKRE
ncbi:MAG: hypothetical protein A7316_06300 [Candidatus Altiarchaeales archaeon WOR_SM1_86-2]|nr:MAG: hypothetical protein A7316_06300 [Candidatus Altiarchaeales archaeon WOR_SM1_86-2]ODS40409.1 MAG: hypothetical protein A7315_08610 [Candidatus Altiarchaeales archaeon WOR_SM1_79]